MILTSSMCQIIGEANHLSGCSFSPQNNFIHPSAELGSKSTVSDSDTRTYLIVFLPDDYIVVFVDLGGATLYAW